MREKPEDALTRRAQARVGTVLRNKWTLDRVLGVGGMAAVFAATHRNGKRGAVKMLHAELNLDEDARRRFLREGYVANKVAHPGAVSVLDDDTTEDLGTVFIVMELLEGSTIDAMASARPSGRLEIREILAFADQLLDVLVAAHEKGIVHRDLKPENLFVTMRGELKVLDFGIARLREFSSGRSSTQTGEAMGTPAFMPPEQALGNWDAVDARTDLWAVGATMFSLLTGRLVHEANTVQKLMLAAMTKPAPLIQSILPGIPPIVAGTVNRALMFDAAERWPSARAMQEAVQRARATLGVNASVPPPASIDAKPVTRQTPDPATGASFGVEAKTIPKLARAKSAERAWLLGAAGAVAVAAIAITLFLSLKREKSPDGSASMLAAPPESSAAVSPNPPASAVVAPVPSASASVAVTPTPSASTSVEAPPVEAATSAAKTAPASSAGRSVKKKNPLSQW